MLGERNGIVRLIGFLLRCGTLSGRVGRFALRRLLCGLLLRGGFILGQRRRLGRANLSFILIAGVKNLLLSAH